MEIKVIKLKEELNDLNSLIKQYEEINLNLYHEIEESTNYWTDNHAMKFFEAISNEKKEVTLTIEELKKTRDIYDYLVKKYKKIGDQINCNINNRKKALSSINLYVEKINEIITNYNNLDLSFCPEVRNYLQIEKNKFINIKDQLEKVSKEMEDTFAYIENMEEEIKLRLSKINIRKIQETDINQFLG